MANQGKQKSKLTRKGEIKERPTLYKARQK